MKRTPNTSNTRSRPQGSSSNVATNRKSSAAATGKSRNVTAGSRSRVSGNSSSTGAKKASTSGATSTTATRKVKPIGSHSKISSTRFNNQKTSNPFSSKRKQYKTTFSSLYDSNAIPCRIFHSTSQMRLQWDRPLDQIAYNPLIVNCAEGLRETAHPYATMARTAFKELCEVPNAAQQILPLLDQVVAQIRGALLDKDPKVFLASLDAIEQLSNAVGGHMDPYLDKILIQVGKKVHQKAYAQKVFQLLNTLEANSGKQETTKKIRAKIPTYESILF